MKIGIPKGLLYYTYKPFIKTFFYELGDEIIESPDTNKDIMDLGIKYCVDEACLPVKLFHGHVAAINGKCDLLLIPRIMQLYNKEYICPKFCGLPEMIYHSIPNLTELIDAPIYAYSREKLFNWCYYIGKRTGKGNQVIKRAFNAAIAVQTSNKININEKGSNLNIALIGHPYNVYDSFINMDIINKLKKMGVGIVTEEIVEDRIINNEIKTLYKKPFWTYARKSYGAASFLSKNNIVNGIIYVSSFSCGIDSVVIELIKDNNNNFPMLILKFDEHTGEAGLYTRLEAFIDMLERRVAI